ncbi:MAG: hypothetical protein L0209_05615 [candidate division Zixibacteria bacterium]|nr:hypothetical protein [candidate division Zixibacteria bacterium]
MKKAAKASKGKLTATESKGIRIGNFSISFLVLSGAFWCFPVLSLYGQSSGIDLLVQPDVVRSITVSLEGGSTSYNFGSVEVGLSTVSAGAIVVSNTGNVGTTLSLHVSSNVDVGGSAPWAAASSPGTNAYSLFGVFQSTRPADGQYTGSDYVILDSPALASNPRFQGGQSGDAVPAGSNNEVNLWLNLFMPTVTTNIRQKKMALTVIAN